MTGLNSVPVDNGPASCGSIRRRETVDKVTRHTQKCPSSKNSVHIGFSGLYTFSTGPSTTTLFFFNRSNN